MHRKGSVAAAGAAIPAAGAAVVATGVPQSAVEAAAGAEKVKKYSLPQLL